MTQFIRVKVWYEEDGQDVEHACFLPGIPRKGDTLILKEDNKSISIGGIISEVVLHAHNATTEPLDCYVTVFLERDTR